MAGAADEAGEAGAAGAAGAEVKNLLKKRTCRAFLRDERGVLEPQADILSTALAMIGFVVFAALLSQAYMGYEDRAFALEHYESASLLAGTIAGSPSLRGESPGLLSAAALDELSGPEGVKERERFFAAFSGNYVFLVEVRTEDGRWQWKIEPDDADPDFFPGTQEKVAASLPVVIELNPAESVPGTLTVLLYKTSWV